MPGYSARGNEVLSTKIQDIYTLIRNRLQTSRPWQNWLQQVARGAGAADCARSPDLASSEFGVPSPPGGNVLRPEALATSSQLIPDALRDSGRPKEAIEGGSDRTQPTSRPWFTKSFGDRVCSPNRQHRPEQAPDGRPVNPSTLTA